MKKILSGPFDKNKQCNKQCNKQSNSEPNLLFAVSECEMTNIKEKYGFVETPNNHVDSMLDSLPSTVWFNPKYKWLDPGCGNGQFARAIVERLMKSLACIIPNEKKRHLHITSNMLTLVECDTSHHTVLETHGLLECTIWDDFLNHDFGIQQFDVIIGNPPYHGIQRKKVPTQQTRSKTTDGITLWTHFVVKSIDLLCAGGYLSMIVPSIWMKPDKAGIYNLLLQQDNIYLYTRDNTETNILFHYQAQTPSVTFMLQKTPNDVIKTHLLSYNESVIRNVHLYDVIYNNYIPYTFCHGAPIPLCYPSIFNRLQRLCNTYGSLEPFVTKTASPHPKYACISQETYNTLSLVERDSLYPNIHSCTLTKRTPILKKTYSEFPLAFAGLRKIVCAHKMHGFPYYDHDGIYGISSRDNYVIILPEPFDTVSHYFTLVQILSTPFVRNLFVATRYRMKYLEKYIFEILPNILVSRDFRWILESHPINEITNFMYKWVGLHPQEIAYFEKHKHKYTYGSFSFSAHEDKITLDDTECSVPSDKINPNVLCTDAR